MSIEVGIIGLSYIAGACHGSIEDTDLADSIGRKLFEENITSNIKSYREVINAFRDYSSILEEEFGVKFNFIDGYFNVTDVFVGDVNGIFSFTEDDLYTELFNEWLESSRDNNSVFSLSNIIIEDNKPIILVERLSYIKYPKTT